MSCDKQADTLLCSLKPDILVHHYHSTHLIHIPNLASCGSVHIIPWVYATAAAQDLRSIRLGMHDVRREENGIHSKLVQQAVQCSGLCGCAVTGIAAAQDHG